MVTELKQLQSSYDIYLIKNVDESAYFDLKKTIDEKLQEIEEIHDNNRKYYRNNDIDPNLYKPAVAKFVLHLSTYGGSVYDAFGIFDLIKKLDNRDDVDLSIRCEGKIMSAGILILLAAKKRTASPNTNFMIHQMLSLTFGKLETIKEDLDESTRLQEIIDNIIVSSTKITKEQLLDWYSHKKDYFFDSKEALELNLINEIV